MQDKCTQFGQSQIQKARKGVSPSQWELRYEKQFFCALASENVENMWTLTVAQSWSVIMLCWLCLALVLINIFIFPLSGWCYYQTVGKHLLTFFKGSVWGFHSLLRKTYTPGSSY